jgi:hypothetical protein
VFGALVQVSRRDIAAASAPQTRLRHVSRSQSPSGKVCLRLECSAASSRGAGAPRLTLPPVVCVRLVRLPLRGGAARRGRSSATLRLCARFLALPFPPRPAVPCGTSQRAGETSALAAAHKVLIRERARGRALVRQWRSSLTVGVSGGQTSKDPASADHAGAAASPPRRHAKVRRSDTHGGANEGEVESFSRVVSRQLPAHGKKRQKRRYRLAWRVSLRCPAFLYQKERFAPRRRYLLFKDAFSRSSFTFGLLAAHLCQPGQHRNALRWVCIKATARRSIFAALD